MAKTYKREFASALVVMWIGLTGMFLWTGEGRYWTVVQEVMPYVLLLSAGAFGLDALAKQIRR